MVQKGAVALKVDVYAKRAPDALQALELALAKQAAQALWLEFEPRSGTIMAYAIKAEVVDATAQDYCVYRQPTMFVAAS